MSNDSDAAVGCLIPIGFVVGGMWFLDSAILNKG